MVNGRLFGAICARENHWIVIPRENGAGRSEFTVVRSGLAQRRPSSTAWVGKDHDDRDGYGRSNPSSNRQVGLVIAQRLDCYFNEAKRRGTR